MQGTRFHRVYASFFQFVWIAAVALGSVAGAPEDLKLAAYGAIHPRLPSLIVARASGEGCGNWYVPYNQLHHSVRSGSVKTKPRYAVMVSTASGLGDRLGATMSVFMYGLLTNRTFEYMWYGKHDLWASFRSRWIDWRVPCHKQSMMISMGNGMDKITALRQEALLDTTDRDFTASKSAENHHWSQPNRSFTSASFYSVDPEVRQRARDLFTKENLLAFGNGSDIVLFSSNQGFTSGMFQNPHLVERLKELGLTWERATPCIFNYLFVPSPEALAPFKNSAMLDILLDSRHEVVGIQIRLGDWVFQRQGAAGPSSELGNRTFLSFGDAHFHCAEQLTAELTAQIASNTTDRTRRTAKTPERRVYWLLISDSVELRAAAERKYGSGGDGRLLVAQSIAVGHVQDHPSPGQALLHAAASELWLFGLASAHVVTMDSSFGRLGALAGGPWLRKAGLEDKCDSFFCKLIGLLGRRPLDESPSVPPMNRIYGIRSHRRNCSLSKPDNLSEVATWWTSVRR